MDPDLFLVIGIIIAVLTIPSLMSAYIDGRTPRAAALLILVSGSMIVFALTKHPGGYALKEVPEAFVRVVGRFLN